MESGRSSGSTVMELGMFTICTVNSCQIQQRSAKVGC